eukprot:g2465.t1
MRLENGQLRSQIRHLERQQTQGTSREAGLFSYIEELERVNQLLVKVAPHELAKRVASQKRVVAEKAKVEAAAAHNAAAHAAGAGGQADSVERALAAEEAMRWEWLTEEAARAAEKEADAAQLAVKDGSHQTGGRRVAPAAAAATATALSEFAPFRSHTERIASLSADLEELSERLAQHKAAEERAKIAAAESEGAAEQLRRELEERERWVARLLDESELLHRENAKMHSTLAAVRGMRDAALNMRVMSTLTEMQKAADARHAREIQEHQEYQRELHMHTHLGGEHMVQQLEQMVQMEGKGSPSLSLSSSAAPRYRLLFELLRDEAEPMGSALAFNVEAARLDELQAMQQLRLLPCRRADAVVAAAAGVALLGVGLRALTGVPLRIQTLALEAEPQDGTGGDDGWVALVGQDSEHSLGLSLDAQPPPWGTDSAEKGARRLVDLSASGEPDGKVALIEIWDVVSGSVHLAIEGFLHAREGEDNDEAGEQKDEQMQKEDGGERHESRKSKPAFIGDIRVIASSDDGSVVAVGCGSNASGLIRIWRTAAATVPVSVSASKEHEQQWRQHHGAKKKEGKIERSGSFELPPILEGCGRCPRRGYPLGIDALALANNNQQLVAAGEGGVILLWALDCEEHLATARATSDAPLAANGAHPHAQLLGRLCGQFADVSFIAFSPDCSLVVSGGCKGDGRVRVWNSHSQHHVQTIAAHAPAVAGGTKNSAKAKKARSVGANVAAGVACLAVSADNLWIVTGGAGGVGSGGCSMRVWLRTLEMEDAYEHLHKASEAAAKAANAAEEKGGASGSAAAAAGAAKRQATAREALPSLTPGLSVGGEEIVGWEIQHSFEHEHAVAMVLFSECGRFVCSTSGKQV